MKRVLAIILTISISMSLFGCGNAAGSEENKSAALETIETGNAFMAGFGKVDITPYEPVNLGSYGNEETRVSEGYLEKLYALTVALSDAEGNTILLIVTDLSWGDNLLNAMVREEVTKKYDIPADHIIVGGTHNHGAPAWDYVDPKVDQYNERWMDSVMESIAIALADRKPAQMQMGRTKTQNLNFVRRYFTDDGCLIGDNYEVCDRPIVAHESQADEEVQMVRFTREEGKDILITNWQAHGTKNRNITYASTDWMGPMREKIEAEMDYHCIYFQGACGNINPTSRFEGECPTQNLMGKEHGEAVAEYVISACKDPNTFQAVDTGLVVNRQIELTAERSSGVEGTMELNAISLGDVSIVTLPLEMSDVSGMQIKNGTPDEMTLLMGYTCGVIKYMMDVETYDRGGYEARNCEWARGTAELIVDTYLSTLKEIKH